MRRHGSVVIPIDVVDGAHRRVILKRNILGLHGALCSCLELCHLLVKRCDATILLGNSVVHCLGFVLLLLQGHLDTLKFGLGVIALGSDLGKVGSLLVAVNAQRIILTLVFLGQRAYRSKLLLETVDEVS